jgi:acyl carrier protein
MNEIINKIRTFIVENFLYGNGDNLKEDTSFLEEGILDSTAGLELVSYLEAEFSIRVGDEDLTPENLDSLRNLRAYLEKKMA